jgi:hypothetical protein
MIQTEVVRLVSSNFKSRTDTKDALANAWKEFRECVQTMAASIEARGSAFGVKELHK